MGPPRKIGKLYAFFFDFSGPRKNDLKWHEMGPGGFFSTNPGLADISGDPDFNFENFNLWDVLCEGVTVVLGAGLVPCASPHYSHHHPANSASEPKYKNDSENRQERCFGCLNHSKAEEIAKDICK